MFERVLSSNVEKAYEELKDLLLKRNCKIVSEEQQKFIQVEQGSVWGMSPKGVKKVISFHLSSRNSGTRVASTSSLTSNWLSLCAIGYMIFAVLISIFWWIAVDLETYVTAQRGSFWGWLAEAFGYTGYQQALALINYFRIFSVLLAVGLIASVVIDVVIYVRRNSFAEETLRLLP